MSYGLVSGYFGGKVDSVLQRFAEIINSIPTLVIVTLLMLVLKPGLMTITLALMLTGWIGMSRIARAQMLKLKQQEFVLASHTLGASNSRVIFSEILPNIISQLITNTMTSSHHWRDTFSGSRQSKFITKKPFAFASSYSFWLKKPSSFMADAVSKAAAAIHFRYIGNFPG